MCRTKPPLLIRTQTLGVDFNVFRIQNGIQQYNLCVCWVFLFRNDQVMFTSLSISKMYFIKYKAQKPTFMETFQCKSQIP